MILIKYKISAVFLSLVFILQICRCGNKGEENVSEVDMKKDLSVQITYRQISYNSIITFKAGTLCVELSGNQEFPDRLICKVNSKEIIFIYDNLEKRFDYGDIQKDFIPKILYEFFSICGESFSTEETRAGEYNFLERSVCGKAVRFCVYQNNTETPYSITIK